MWACSNVSWLSESSLSSWNVGRRQQTSARRALGLSECSQWALLWPGYLTGASGNCCLDVLTARKDNIQLTEPESTFGLKLCLGKTDHKILLYIWLPSDGIYISWREHSELQKEHSADMELPSKLFFVLQLRRSNSVCSLPWKVFLKIDLHYIEIDAIMPRFLPLRASWGPRWLQWWHRLLLCLPTLISLHCILFCSLRHCCPSCDTFYFCCS